MLYKFAKFVTYIYVKIAFKITYAGTDNIPKDKGFILTSNHRTNHDAVFIIHKIRRQVRYMAKIEIFKYRIIARAALAVGAFPVDRGSGDATPMQTAKTIIDDGGILGIFIEGTRSKTGELLRPRSGTAMLAAQTGADILPCAVCFGKRLSFRTPVTIRYGETIPAHSLGIDISDSKSIREASKLIMAQISGLIQQGVR